VSSVWQGELRVFSNQKVFLLSTTPPANQRVNSTGRSAKRFHNKLFSGKCRKPILKCGYLGKRLTTKFLFDSQNRRVCKEIYSKQEVSIYPTLGRQPKRRTSQKKIFFSKKKFKAVFTLARSVAHPISARKTLCSNPASSPTPFLLIVLMHPLPVD